jgi:hypothetical protein
MARRRKEAPLSWGNEDIAGSETNLEYEFTVRSAHFGTDARIGEGEVFGLIWEGEIDFGDGPDDGFRFFRINNFEKADGEGTAAVHISGDESKRFHPKSKVQRFIKEAVELGWPGSEKGDSSLEAAIWVGSHFRIRRVEDSFTDRETKEVVEYSLDLPVEYLGEVEVAGKARRATVATLEAVATTNGDGDIDVKLAALASSNDEYLDFFVAAAKLGLDTKDARLTEDSYAQLRG